MSADRRAVLERCGKTTWKISQYFYSIKQKTMKTMKTISMVCLCMCLGFFSAYSQPLFRCQVFTLHPDGAPVTLYEDFDLTNKRMDIYPDPYECNAGFMVYIDGQFKNALCVRIGAMNNTLYIPQGKLGVNTRNYDLELYLYEQPSRNSSVALKFHEPQTVAIYGIEEGWLYVEALSDDGKPVRGWLPPDRQCGNPYTTCP